MFNPDQTALIEFVQERAPDLPVTQRVKVYRGLADFTTDRELRQSLVGKSRILEEAEAKCLELNLTFHKEAL